jgi:TolB protein
VAILDVFDFHEGSSDVPIWANDGRGIYYTAQFGANVELMWASLEGEVRQLTRSTEGALHYHPKVSPDGRWLAFGSTRSGTRQLYVRPSDPSSEEAEIHAITDLAEGWAAMWPHWQPGPREEEMQNAK